MMSCNEDGTPTSGFINLLTTFCLFHDTLGPDCLLAKGNNNNNNNSGGRELHLRVLDIVRNQMQRYKCTDNSLLLAMNCSLTRKLEGRPGYTVAVDEKVAGAVSNGLLDDLIVPFLYTRAVKDGQVGAAQTSLDPASQRVVGKLMHSLNFTSMQYRTSRALKERSHAVEAALKSGFGPPVPRTFATATTTAPAMDGTDRPPSTIDDHVRSIRRLLSKISMMLNTKNNATAPAAPGGGGSAANNRASPNHVREFDDGPPGNAPSTEANSPAEPTLPAPPRTAAEGEEDGGAGADGLCNWCHVPLSPASKKRCSMCNTSYCSKECQKNDWKKGNHKAKCRDIALSSRMADGRGGVRIDDDRARRESSWQLQRAAEKLFGMNFFKAVAQAILRKWDILDSIVVIDFCKISPSIRTVRYGDIVRDLTQDEFRRKLLGIMIENRAKGMVTAAVYGHDLSGLSSEVVVQSYRPIFQPMYNNVDPATGEPSWTVFQEELTKHIGPGNIDAILACPSEKDKFMSNMMTPVLSQEEAIAEEASVVNNGARPGNEIVAVPVVQQPPPPGGEMMNGGTIPAM